MMRIQFISSKKINYHSQTLFLNGIHTFSTRVSYGSLSSQLWIGITLMLKKIHFLIPIQLKFECLFCFLKFEWFMMYLKRCLLCSISMFLLFLMILVFTLLFLKIWLLFSISMFFFDILIFFLFLRKCLLCLFK
jgi:hypothetical protein